MSDTIKSLLDGGKLKTSMIQVQLIKQISSNSYIIADKSMVAILDIQDAPSHSNHLNQGCWYKLIKCNKGEKNTIKTNKLFKPVKTLVKNELPDMSAQVQKLENAIVSSATSKKYEDLQTISMKPNQAKIDKLTVKVITKSRVITTSKGNYQICNIKDCKGDNSSINLYSKHLNRLEPFKIYTITNLRKGEVIKNEETKMRLHTNSFTKIEDGTIEDSMNFKQIGNGDQSVTGTVIGYGDISIYQSCKLHYKKIDENLKCPNCETELNKDGILDDCRTELFIEAEKGDKDEEESDVKEILIFKRVLAIKEGENIEEHLNELTGHMVKIDYNIDNAERFIAVSIDLVK